jgi:hypothetical protein
MSGWTQLTLEPLRSRPVEAFVRSLLGTLSGLQRDQRRERERLEEGLESVIQSFLDRAHTLVDPRDRSWCLAIVGVLNDLFQQGWTLALRKLHLWGLRPTSGEGREELRHRLLVRRDEQLAKSSVRDFIRGMERWRVHHGRRTSILSLMRDGRSLSEAIARGTSVQDLMEPYLQFVSANEICKYTGLRLQDIWRYFRHTWSSPYESVPGRSLQLLVRDSSVVDHPVIGIAALSSAAVRLGPRDRYIGWDTEQVTDRLLSADLSEANEWSRACIACAFDEIYKLDFIRDGLLPTDMDRWTEATAVALAGASAIAKEQHHRLMASGEYDAYDDVSTEAACRIRAELPLFRAKRAQELSNLIRMRLQLCNPTLAVPERRDLIGKLVRLARSKTVGTEIADLTVCGAIAPYSHLAAGKLIALLAVSPPVVAEYKRRYQGTAGIISSSVAGRPIRRAANLCYVGTTSLYGKRPNQYDRLSVSAAVFGGPANRSIRYDQIREQSATRTQGVGTFHFSSRTVKSLERYVTSQKGGWRANNLFGEGTSPKLRGLRDGLSSLGLDASLLLVHGIERCIYGVKLADNVDRYLLGIDSEPEWLFSSSEDRTAQLFSWWTERWANRRGAREDVRSAIRNETLAHPISHHARVQLPDTGNRQLGLT